MYAKVWFYFDVENGNDSEIKAKIGELGMSWENCYWEILED